MASIFGPGTLLVDDGDPSIQYTCSNGQSWTIGGLPGREIDGTTHGTSSAACKINYTFFGSSIRVYGTIPGYHDTTPVAGEGAVSGYYLDNSTTPSQIFVATPRQDTLFQQIFFQSPNMSDGTHSLTITLFDDTFVDDTLGYWVDFFVITPGVSVSGVSQTSSVPFSLTKTIARTSTTTLLPTVTPVKKSSRTTGSILAADIGPAIVGGLLLLGTVMIYGPRLWRRIKSRRRHLQIDSSDHVPTRETAQIAPLSTPNIDEVSPSGSRPANLFTESDRGLVLELGARPDSPPPPPPAPTSSRPVNPFTSTSPHDAIEEVARNP